MSSCVWKCVTSSFWQLKIIDIYWCFNCKDRAERAARFAKTKEEVEAAKAAALLSKQAEMEVKKESYARERRYFTLLGEEG